MFGLWRKWVVYPLTWLLVMVALLTASAVWQWFHQDDIQPTMESFHGDYVASTDGEQMQLQVTETITARLRGDRGIERRLITRYDGQPMDIGGIRVVDQQGVEYPVQTRAEGSDLVLRIGDPATPLFETKTYVIHYTIGRAMIQETDRQELYLNVNGLEWPNGFSSVSAQLVVDDDLAPHLLGEHACYQGRAGSRATCDLDVEGATYRVDAGMVGAFENVTIAVGFQDRTVSDPMDPLRPASHGWMGILILVGIGALALVLSLLMRAWSRSLGRSEQGVVTRFTPPEGIDPLLAADFLGRPEKGPSAHLAYLVVEGMAELHAPGGEQQPGPDRDKLSSFEARSLAREIRLAWHREKVPGELRYVTRSMLGRSDEPQRLSLVYSSADYARIWETRQDRVLSAGLRRRFSFHGPMLFFGFLGLLGYGGFQVLNGLAGLGWWFLLAGVLGTIALLAAVHLAPTLGPLTKKGREVRRELLGLERFVMLAEKDRIAWLQNVKDAPRDGDRVHLYEKLLPWAIVFGAERSWAKVAGEMHDQFPELPTAPDLAWIATANSIQTEYNRYHHHHHSWWDTRSDIGSGPTATAARDFSEWYSSREHDSRRSSGGGWSGGGGGGSSFSGGSSGSSGGGFSGGGVGGGGGGRW